MPVFGRISTFAGTGVGGYAGDNGAALQAQLRQPFYCDFDRHGSLYIAEAENNVIRAVDRAGRIRTVVGNGRKGDGGDGGPAAEASLHEPVAVVVDRDASLYIADRLNARVRRVDGRTGIITTIAGTGVKGFGGDNGPGREAQLKEPHDVALDGNGGLLIADVGDSRIRRVDLKTGIITAWGGTGRRAREGDGGPLAAASFHGARAVAVDPRDGTVYVCEREGNAIRRVDGRTRIVTLYAGTGKKGYAGDNGPAVQATFSGPKGARCDGRGNLFVVDTENHAIRRIDAVTGLITTVAGGVKGGHGDGGLAALAGLDRPHGVAVGPDGALYIADSNNHRVRRVAAPPAGQSERPVNS